MTDSKFSLTFVGRVKNGVLWNAIKAKGLSVRQAAEFLGIGYPHLVNVLNLKCPMPFIFSTREADRQRAIQITEKLMELTDKTIDEIFPESIRRKEFLLLPKAIDYTVEVNADNLLGFRETLALPATPDSIVAESEEMKQLDAFIEELSPAVRDSVEQLRNGKTLTEIAEQRNCSRSCIEQQVKGAIYKLQKKKELADALERRCDPTTMPQVP